MSFFDWFKPKKTQQNEDDSKLEQVHHEDGFESEADDEDSTLVLAMPMFCGEAYQLDRVIEDLKNYWHCQIGEVTGDETTATFDVDGIMVALAIMPAPIPQEELEPLFEFSYLYPNVTQEVPQHTQHAIVSVLGAETKLEAYKLLTKLNASILRTTETAIGIYQGSATLLLPKGLYCDFADFLQEESLPVVLWIFIGIIHHEQSRSLYTYGLQEFGRMEMEIIESPMLASDLHDFMLPTLAYLLDYDVYLQDGETIGFSAEHKIQIQQSEAVYLDGESLKLIM